MSSTKVEACSNTDCTQKGECYRFHLYETPRDEWQSTAKFIEKDGKCQWYISNTIEK